MSPDINTSASNAPASDSWKQLEAIAAETRHASIEEQLRISGRAQRFMFDLGPLYVDLSKHAITDQILQLLLKVADDTGVLVHAQRMATGESVNVSENRPALHMGLRNPARPLPQEFIDRVVEEQAHFASLSDQIRSGSWTGSGRDAITDVINIGIGGSDLGPKMVVQALREFHTGPRVHFISNVDGAEILSLLKTLNARSTMIVISSKSFTTNETLLNAKTALRWLSEALGIDNPQCSTHCIAVTNDREKAQAFGIPENQILTFTESIGGRYSTWSSVGFAVCIALGFGNFKLFLDGGARVDHHFLNTSPEKNIPLLMGLFGIWYNNFLKAETHCVIPYCERLGFFVDHLQQLDMESNGKSSTLDGERVAVNTGPIVWGQTGTNSQHAFFQLLHQGTKLVPVDFIGIIRDESSDPEHHRILMASMIAQSEALMTGWSGPDAHQQYSGNRPSSTLLLDTLNPESLGMLLALYEHKVFVQGSIWSINSFDQWGVELGKQLTNRILTGATRHDISTSTLLKKTGLPD